MAIGERCSVGRVTAEACTLTRCSSGSKEVDGKNPESVVPGRQPIKNGGWGREVGEGANGGEGSGAQTAANDLGTYRRPRIWGPTGGQGSGDQQAVKDLGRSGPATKDLGCGRPAAARDLG